MARGIATPLIAVCLILAMELSTQLLSRFEWYSPAFVVLYIAFLANAWYDCGRLANLVAAAFISAYTLYSLPDEPFRAGVFILVTFGIALADGAIKERIITMARQLERAIQENNRQTLEIRRQSEAMAEIAQLGEIQPIIARIREAREIILAYLRKHPDDDLRTALHKLNSAELSSAGWKSLNQAIERAKRERLERLRVEDLLDPMTDEEIEAGPEMPE